MARSFDWNWNASVGQAERIPLDMRQPLPNEKDPREEGLFDMSTKENA
tara:strand:- start:70 stop:213 length:144 start_codon:yes stop_codon:yes gene_type:complete